MSGRELLRLLESLGWVSVRIRGSHHVLKKLGRTIILPVHGNSDVKRGLLSSILKKAGLK
ncbi:MAG: type II toxin-antitoxin system HicA family toxin [Spirochaetota bacterium]